MKKYQIVLLKNDKALDARTKAPKDAERVLAECGYMPLYIKFQQNHTSTARRIGGGIILIINILKTILKIPNGSEVFLQYPTTRYWYLFTTLLKWKKIRMGVVIIDTESYRKDGQMSRREIQELSTFDKIIAHTDAMREVFIRDGIDAKHIQSLHVWDYYVDKLGSNQEVLKIPACVIFAGNPEKSRFLQKIDTLQDNNKVYHFRLYGNAKNKPNSTFVEYANSFQSEDISSVSGTWGLVWDGDSIETASDNYGVYLRISTPHKIGLYLAKGIPVIVWSESGVAPFITANKLGIAVNSLHELKDRLARITPQEMDAIRASVQVFSQKVRNGEMLKAALQAFDN